ncbi:MAG: LPXTG cell wall anchor domain-containing protein, partial [Syntrophomonadaceae bacterium]|nr:LPXTG cell wall anchor domain-containing protein [Syntrophomonadaceae bacterium]
FVSKMMQVFNRFSADSNLDLCKEFTSEEYEAFMAENPDLTAAKDKDGNIIGFTFEVTMGRGTSTVLESLPLSQHYGYSVEQTAGGGNQSNSGNTVAAAGTLVKAEGTITVTFTNAYGNSSSSGGGNRPGPTVTPIPDPEPAPEPEPESVEIEEEEVALGPAPVIVEEEEEVIMEDEVPLAATGGGSETGFAVLGMLAMLAGLLLKRKDRKADSI